MASVIEKGGLKILSVQLLP